MSGYTPLFKSITMSSIWNEDDPTRIVFVTLLAEADADGTVEGSVAGLAVIARVSIEQCEKALERLQSPDPYSRTKDYEGRRIKEIEGGWLILNHGKFRQKAKSRAAYMRQYRQEKKKAAKEEKNKDSNPNPNTNKVTECNNPVTAVTVTQSYSLQQVKDACIANGIPESNAQSYYDQYNSQDWKKGNGQQISNLQSHMAKRWLKSKQCWDFDERKSTDTQSEYDKLKAKGEI